MGVLEPGKFLIGKHEKIPEQHLTICRAEPLFPGAVYDLFFLEMHVDKCGVVQQNMGKRIVNIVLGNGSLNTAIPWQSIFEKILWGNRTDQKGIVVKINKLFGKSFDPV